jgi:hypothetical protein
MIRNRAMAAMIIRPIVVVMACPFGVFKAGTKTGTDLKSVPSKL